MAPSLVEKCICRRAWYKYGLCCVSSLNRSTIETDLAEHCFLLTLGIGSFFPFSHMKAEKRTHHHALSLSSKMAAGSPSW